MTFKTSTGVTAALAVAALALAGCASTTTPGDDSDTAETIKIAMPIELTGPVAPFAVPLTDAMTLAVEKINEQGGIKSKGGAKLELLIQDSQSDPERAAQLLREMAAEGAVMALGPQGSGGALASKPLLENLNLPWLGVSIDSQITEDNDQNIMWRVVTPASSWADGAIDFLKKEIDAGNVAVEKVGIVSATVPPGPSVKEALTRGLTELGIEVAAIDYDQIETKDYGPIVAAMRDADVDLITGFQNPNDSVQFAQAVGLQEWQPSEGFFWIAGGQYLNSFRATLGDATAGWLDSSYGTATTACEPGNEFAAEYEDRFGQSLTGLNSVGPALIQTAASVLELAESTEPEAIKEAFASVEIGSCEGLYALAGGVGFASDGSNTNFLPTIVQHEGDMEQVAVWPEELATRSAIWPARPE